MGLFNHISNFEMPCPTCGRLVKDFQTKDEGRGMELYLDYVTFQQVRNFYSQCGNKHCKTWIEFNLKPNPNVNIDDYEMTIEEA